jgi:hypothetical protein
MQQRLARSLVAVLILTAIFFIYNVPAIAGQTQQARVEEENPPTAATPEPVPAPADPKPQAQTAAPEPSAPLQFKIGDATITPIGFMDLTNTFRSTNSGASLATNFGNFPYQNNLPTGRLTEDRFSAQNSRIGFRVDAKVKNANILGYFEGDFVGGVGGSGSNIAFNTQVTSNSIVYRMRLYWIDVRQRNFEFLAGQSWSMMTPNRKQISALPGDLFYGQEFDVNYLNGLTWGRIPGLRFLYHFNEKVTWGLSLENASQYFGGSGGAGNPTLPTALNISSMLNQLDGGGNGGLSGTAFPNGLAAPQVHPDIITRLAFDPNSRIHFEFTGVESTVRLLNTSNPANLVYHHTVGVGGSFNGIFEVVKNLRLVTNNFWSQGEGRYIFGQAPNFIVRSDGAPSSIHSGSTIQGFEATIKNSLIYGYYGGVYILPNTAIDPGTAGPPAVPAHLIGWGFQPAGGNAGAPNSQNRVIQEGTTGMIQTLWRDPKYGSLQLMGQYAYFTRSPYFVPSAVTVPPTPSNAHQHAVWFNVRYTLPGSAPTITPPQ